MRRRGIGLLLAVTGLFLSVVGQTLPASVAPTFSSAPNSGGTGGASGGTGGTTSCSSCLLFVGGLVTSAKYGLLSQSELERVVKGLCPQSPFVQGAVEDPEIFCEAFSEYYSGVYYELFLSPEVNVRGVCEKLGFCPHLPLSSAELRAQYAKTFQPEDLNFSSVAKQKRERRGVGYFWQISDIHLDDSYQVGTEANCPYDSCCRDGFYNVVKEEGTSQNARPLGEYSCDSNLPLLQLALKTIAEHDKKADFMLWTGDTLPHSPYLITLQDAMENFRFVTSTIRSALPNLTVYPAIGNHDSHPQNQFPLVDFSNWIFRNSSQLWGPWLNTEAKATLRRAGYYTILQSPKLRIVSLNTLSCYTNNLWNQNYEEDPWGQLAWLASVLDHAKKNDEKVYVIAHISPGDTTCTADFSYRYSSLLSRYSDVVVAHFFGHVHLDLFQMFKDVETDKPIGYGFFAPAMTTYTDINPSLRLYKYNRTTGQILNYEQYRLDLAAAHNEPEPQFQLSYLFSQLLLQGTEGVTTEKLTELVRRLETEDEGKKFAELVETGGPRALQGCGPRCLGTLLCLLNNSISDLLLSCAAQYTDLDALLFNGFRTFPS